MTMVRNPLEKTERNEEIVLRVLRGKGEISLNDLGKEYGLTRSRIQRIVGEAGFSMRAIKSKNKKPQLVKCKQCDNTYPKGKYIEHCEQAGHRRLTPPGEKVDRNAEMVRLNKAGYNTSEMAEYFDVPQPVVTRILHRNGIYAERRRSRKGGLQPGGWAKRG